MQESLTRGGVQTRLSRIEGESLTIFLDSLVPPIALKQQICENSVSPGRFGVKMCATIGKACGQIQVLMTKPKPRVASLRIERCYLAKFVRSTAEVFLAEIGSS